MRYQRILLSALGGLVVAKDDASAGSTSGTGSNAPDALPLKDLRDVPVPTYAPATGVTNQDIPYAAADAIALVSSLMAETPLSVFPAATNVPINAAGSSPNDADPKSDSNIIAIPVSNVKRRSPNPPHHPHEKRQNCAARPTIPNTYNVSLANATSFRTDAAIALVANTATRTPTGYYQTFRNLSAATSAMNYLGFLSMPAGKGYDVAYCAASCSAKAGCLAFNIYFERDPTLAPAAACPNPPAFANIKCSFWGTAIDNSTATNKGGGNFQFVIAVAGSNGYVSYKLGGPVDGWTSQNLNSSVMNAPLYDCTHTWTYLGYKLLQTGSVDPRLCAAACDAQTPYDKAHPATAPGTSNSTSVSNDTAAAPVISCNAFGSYILTRTIASNITTRPAVSVQLGQMCTFYTANWDKRFAVNGVAYDDGIRAKYTYLYSSFYGKKGAQLPCNGTVVSGAGTYVSGR